MVYRFAILEENLALYQAIERIRDVDGTATFEKSLSVARGTCLQDDNLFYLHPEDFASLGRYVARKKDKPS